MYTSFKLSYLLIPFLLVTQACGIYKLNGASIPDGMKTFNVQFFENSAPIVVPYLSQQFTEALKTQIRNQTRLSQVNSEGDAIFEGRITGYAISSTAVGGANDMAQANRLSITVAVKYVDNIKPENSFEQSFTRYQDFQGTVQSQEQNLITAINKQLTEDIFNRAFANW
ncbi:hypothetical protein GCM10023231_37650 [Olivibacter ginsenosidimutans]|uniref:LptE family protein n=1 Tax=Olivibacter ginsenosidimutans TaxID=1176537 RepID=A0ABP9C5M4_9SPHI